MRKTFWIGLTALLLAQVLAAQATFRAPTITTKTTSVYWTAGTVNNGGHSVAITAGSHALDASRASCAAPAFATCDILYANSAGAVDISDSNVATAAAAGNTILAFIETNATPAATSVVLAAQSGTMWNTSVGFGGTTTSLTPAAAGGSAVGATLLPYSGIYLGNAATLNFLLTGTAGQATTITIPDPGGAAATLAYRNVAQTFTGAQTFGAIIATGITGLTAAPAPNVAGAIGIGTALLPFGHVFIGNAATNNAQIIGTFAAARVLTVPDPGGAASFAFTNSTTAQTLANTSVAQISAASYNSFTTLPTVIGMAYTDTADVAGRQWFSSIYIPTSVTLTGVCLKLGTVPATDLWIGVLWNSLGATVATSNLAGVAFGATGAAQYYQCQSFTAPVPVTGPARYFVGIQGNGNTANEFYTYPAASAPAGYATGITAPGVFGTITAIAPTTTFTAAQGPIMSVY